MRSAATAAVLLLVLACTSAENQEPGGGGGIGGEIDIPLGGAGGGGGGGGAALRYGGVYLTYPTGGTAVEPGDHGLLRVTIPGTTFSGPQEVAVTVALQPVDGERREETGTASHDTVEFGPETMRFTAPDGTATELVGQGMAEDTSARGAFAAVAPPVTFYCGSLQAGGKVLLAVAPGRLAAVVNTERTVDAFIAQRGAGGVTIEDPDVSGTTTIAEGSAQGTWTIHGTEHTWTATTAACPSFD